MNDFSRDLVDLLRVRPAGDDRFVGDTEPYGVPGRVFGGHFVAQGLSAAFSTLGGGAGPGGDDAEGREDADEFAAHALHAHFHKAGDSSAPVEYSVQTLRDGRSFSSRHVVARQHGAVVFSMSASFKTRDGDEFFQPPMPEAPDPDAALAALGADAEAARRAPPAAGGRVRMARTTNGFLPREALAPGETRDAQFRAWLQVPGAAPLSARDQQILLAFVSDGPLPFCSVVLHGEPFGTHQHTSLDHAVWFHRPANLRDWVLFDSEPVATADGRGLNDGRLFARDGTLLASIRQESLMRRLREGAADPHPFAREMTTGE